MNWAQLIEERNAWIAHNFPNPSMPDPGQSVMGCVEEVGELAHAHLKRAQSIRGTDDEHVAAGKDAVADTTIYLLGVMAYTGDGPVLPSHRRSPTTPDEAIFLASGAVGRLSLAYVNDRGYQGAVDHLVYYLTRYCAMMEWDYDAIVLETWAKVKQRDWIAYPDTGLPPDITEVNVQADVYYEVDGERRIADFKTNADRGEPIPPETAQAQTTQYEGMLDEGGPLRPSDYA